MRCHAFFESPPWLPSSFFQLPSQPQAGLIGMMEMKRWMYRVSKWATLRPTCATTTSSYTHPNLEKTNITVTAYVVCHATSRLVGPI